MHSLSLIPAWNQHNTLKRLLVGVLGWKEKKGRGISRRPPKVIEYRLVFILEFEIYPAYPILPYLSDFPYFPYLSVIHLRLAQPELLSKAEFDLAACC